MAEAGKHDEDKPEPGEPNKDVDAFLDRFASIEARRILKVSQWFLYTAVAAIAIEVLVAYLDEYPKLAFVTGVLDRLGKFVLSCDATVFAVFVLVASLLAINELLKLVGIDVIGAGRWVTRNARAWWRNRRTR